MSPPLSTITLVSVWMGPLPAELPLFLQGCRANPSVSVLLPCDQPAPDHLPPNVRWLPMTLAEFNARASRQLGVPVHVKRGYKLCDLKPVYGVVFEEELAGQDFWGVCDLDLVFGDLRHFLTEAFLASGDLFSFRGPWWLSGALQLYRAASPATRLYEQVPGWPRIVADETYRGMDESGFRFDGKRQSVAHLLAAGAMVSLTDVAREAEANGHLRLVTPEWIAEPSVQWTPVEMEWKRGTLTDLRTGKDHLLCHFVRLKHEPFVVLEGWSLPGPDTFYLTATGTTTIPPGGCRRVAHAARRRVCRLPTATAWGARKVWRRVKQAVRGRQHA